MFAIEDVDQAPFIETPQRIKDLPDPMATANLEKLLASALKRRNTQVTMHKSAVSILVAPLPDAVEEYVRNDAVVRVLESAGWILENPDEEKPTSSIFCSIDGPKYEFAIGNRRLVTREKNDTVVVRIDCEENRVFATGKPILSLRTQILIGTSTNRGEYEQLVKTTPVHFPAALDAATSSFKRAVNAMNAEK